MTLRCGIERLWLSAERNFGSPQNWPFYGCCAFPVSLLQQFPEPVRLSERLRARGAMCFAADPNSSLCSPGLLMAFITPSADYAD